MKLLLLLLLSLSHVTLAQECVKIRSSKNPEAKSINIVFVPSGFNNEMDRFEDYIREFWAKLEEYTPFSRNVETINVTILKKGRKENSFCSFKGRLLNCDSVKAYNLSKNCELEGGKRQTIVIHNSTQYGGQGGSAATASTNLHVIPMIVHELGHSLFELSDEYELPDAAQKGKNCVSAGSACSKWQDLIDAGLASCQPGCRNRAGLTSEDSVMRTLDHPSFGHVNQRYICCTFKKHTGEYPSFCDQYQNVGRGLNQFCR